MPLVVLKLYGEELKEYLCDMCKLEPALHTLGFSRVLGGGYAVCDECLKKLPQNLQK